LSRCFASKLFREEFMKRSLFAAALVLTSSPQVRAQVFARPAMPHRSFRSLAAL
jgi:hypothetical protein